MEIMQHTAIPKSLNSLMKSFLMLTFSLTLMACSENKEPSPPQGVPIQINNDRSDNRNKMLAYEHSVTINLNSQDVLSVYNSTIDLCQTDIELKCSLLSANFNSNSYDFSTIQVRVIPSGVNTLINHIKTKGELTQQSTHIEDLTESYVETDKRIEMLTEYRNKLQQIQIQAANDVESLIKIASELTTTQKQIEATQNNKSRLEQRIDRDLLTINLSSNLRESQSFWQSIGSSIAEIPESFSYGLSSTIDEITYLFPWLLVIIILFILFRWLWHKTAAKTK